MNNTPRTRFWEQFSKMFILMQQCQHSHDSWNQGFWKKCLYPKQTEITDNYIEFGGEAINMWVKSLFSRNSEGEKPHMGVLGTLNVQTDECTVYFSILQQHRLYNNQNFAFITVTKIHTSSLTSCCSSSSLSISFKSCLVSSASASPLGKKKPNTC